MNTHSRKITIKNRSLSFFPCFFFIKKQKKKEFGERIRIRWWCGGSECVGVNEENERERECGGLFRFLV